MYFYYGFNKNVIVVIYILQWLMLTLGFLQRSPHKQHSIQLDLTEPSAEKDFCSQTQL